MRMRHQCNRLMTHAHEDKPVVFPFSWTFLLSVTMAITKLGVDLDVLQWKSLKKWPITKNHKCITYKLAVNSAWLMFVVFPYFEWRGLMRECWVCRPCHHISPGIIVIIVIFPPAPAALQSVSLPHHCPRSLPAPPDTNHRHTTINITIHDGFIQHTTTSLIVTLFIL